MKKMVKMMMLAGGFLLTVPVFAGGLITNTNQSATFIRMLARNATLGIDGVYYNPAGLVYLDEGWHLSLNNQTAFQTRTITNSLSTLRDGTYKGSSRSPVIPSLHAVYRKGDFAYSFGFGIFGGGGTLEFDRGIPLTETQVSFLPRSIAALGIPVTAYSVEQYLKGSSATYGGQLGVSYKINDMFSASAGVRVVYTSNGYDAYLRSIQVDTGGGLIPATTFFTNLGAATGNDMSENIARVSDKTIDVKQSGIGVTPILGVNFCYEKLTLAARFEFNTGMDLENDTKEDGTGMFPDKAKTPTDIPAILSLGGAYDLTRTLKFSLGYNHYFNKGAKMEKDKQKLLNDGNEYLAGVEWDCHQYFMVSAGCQYTASGITPGYQSDMSHSFNSYSVGAGGAIKITQKVRVNVGYFFTKYTPNSKQITYEEERPWQETATETYKRTNNVFALGLDIRF